MYGVVQSMSLGTVLNYSERVRVEENNRFEFWRSQLAIARNWPPIRAQADASVDKLDKIRPRTAQ